MDIPVQCPVFRGFLKRRAIGSPSLPAMTLLATLLSLAIGPQSGHASTWSQRFTSGDGSESFTQVVAAPDGSLIAAGVTTSFAVDGTDLWVVKVGPEGEVLWQRAIGGEGDQVLASAALDSDGGLLLVAKPGPYSGEDNVAVVKLDALGEVEWRTHLATTSAGGIAPCPGGGAVAVGSGPDAWVAKLDGNGRLEWSRSYGGPESDGAVAVQPISGGRFVVVAQTMSLGSKDWWDVPRPWVLRLTDSGEVESEWVYQHGFVKQVVFDDGSGAALLLLEGRTEAPAAIRYGFALKLNAAHEPEWRRGVALADGAARTPDGGYLVTSQPLVFRKQYLLGSSILAGFDSNGREGWSRVYSEGTAAGATADLEGHYVVAGRFHDMTDETDAWLAKLDRTGGIGPSCPPVAGWNAGSHELEDPGSREPVVSTHGAGPGTVPAPDWTISTTVAAATLSCQADGTLPTAAFSWSPATPIAGEQILFNDATSGGVMAWLWDFAGESTSTLPNPVFAFSAEGSYPVCLLASNTSGSDGACEIIEVDPGPTELSAMFTWEPEVPAPVQATRFTDLSSGAVSSWSWDFGDGQSSDAQHPSHGFAAAGQYQVCLTVTDGADSHQSCRSLVVVEQTVCGNGTCEQGENNYNCADDCLPVCGNGLCEPGETTINCGTDCAQRPNATNRAPLPCSDCAVPAAVGGVPGTGDTFWLSEAVLYNPGPDPAVVKLEFTLDDDPSTRLTAGPFLLQAEEARQYDNLVMDLFGVTANGSIRTQSDTPVMVFSRTFNDDPQGTYGQMIAAWRGEQTLGFGDTAAYVLGVQENPSYRTNLVIQEVAGVPTSVVVTANRADGVYVHQVLLVVPAHGKLQRSLARLGFPRLDDSFLTVEVMSGGQIAVLASVIDQRTGDPRTVHAVHGSQVLVRDPGLKTDGEAHYLVAVIARSAGVGGSLWRSRAQIQNPFSSPQTVRLRYYPEGLPPMESAVEVGSLEQVTVGDVIADLFADAGDGKGSLHVFAPTGVIVNTDTFNETPGGTYGQFIVALGPGDLIGPGETGKIVGLASSSAFRTNIGFSAFDDSDTVVSITVLSYSSPFAAHILGSATLTVEGYRNLQVNRLLSWLGVTGEHANIVVSLAVISGGKVYAYASKVDNLSGDPTFIAAQRLD